MAEPAVVPFMPDLVEAAPVPRAPAMGRSLRINLASIAHRAGLRMAPFSPWPAAGG